MYAFLVEHGANVNHIQDNVNHIRTVLQICNYVPVVKILLSLGANPNLNIGHFFIPNVDKLKVLLQHRLNPNLFPAAVWHQLIHQAHDEFDTVIKNTSYPLNNTTILRMLKISAQSVLDTYEFIEHLRTYERTYEAVRFFEALVGLYKVLQVASSSRSRLKLTNDVTTTLTKTKKVLVTGLTMRDYNITPTMKQNIEDITNKLQRYLN